MRGFAITKNVRDFDRYYFGAHDDAGRDLEGDRSRLDREQWVTSGVHASARPDVLRLWLEAEASAAGWPLEDLIAVVKRGPISAGARVLYDQLAVLVSELRRKGASCASIGEAIGRQRQTVANLERRGRELAECAEREAAALAAAARETRRKPCRRHAKFEPDCPECLRNAPEEAVAYSGLEQLRGQLVGGSRES